MIKQPLYCLWLEGKTTASYDPEKVMKQIPERARIDGNSTPKVIYLDDRPVGELLVTDDYQFRFRKEIYLLSIIDGDLQDECVRSFCYDFRDVLFHCFPSLPSNYREYYESPPGAVPLPQGCSFEIVKIT